MSTTARRYKMIDENHPWIELGTIIIIDGGSTRNFKVQGKNTPSRWDIHHIEQYPKEWQHLKILIL